MDRIEHGNMHTVLYTHTHKNNNNYIILQHHLTNNFIYCTHFMAIMNIPPLQLKIDILEYMIRSYTEIRDTFVVISILMAVSYCPLLHSSINAHQAY